MSYNITNPLYPRPTSGVGGTSFLTSQITSITSGVTTVTGYNTNAPGAVDLVTFEVDGDDVRVFWEGSTPTASVGHILPSGTAYTWAAIQYNNSKFILKTGSTASVITASPFTSG